MKGWEGWSCWMSQGQSGQTCLLAWGTTKDKENTTLQTARTHNFTMGLQSVKSMALLLVLGEPNRK